jgi:hypothetical protein
VRLGSARPMKARLAIVVAVGSLALVAAPEAALADNPPTQVSPGGGAMFTARVGQIAFQAQATANPTTLLFPTLMDFYVSQASVTDPTTGVLSDNPTVLHASPGAGSPPTYTASPGSAASWPKTPGTYYWQAVYHDCTQSLDCFNQSPTRTLTINPLAPPTQVSPADGATIPYGSQHTFSVQDQPSYARDGTRLHIEFAKSNDLDSDGTFANPVLVVKPQAVGGDVYEYDFGQPFNQLRGTYYWIVDRTDGNANADGIVTNDEIRSFSVAPPVVGRPPNTRITRHPGHRTHRRRVTFRFSSSIPGASFQCFYTGGWTRCRSPQTFRHLRPGRYRFKVRALANGKRDPTPAKWLFKVVRQHKRR